MHWKVLVSAPYMQPVLDRFRSVLEEAGCELCVPPVAERMEEDDLLRCVGDVDGAICGDDRFTERVLAAAPRLKVISKWGTGIDSIDQDACHKLGIAVRNTPNAFSHAVADTVMGYILCFARQLPWMHLDIQAGCWKKRPSVALNECSLGVIGVGNVGKAVLRRAAAFGMRLLGNDIVDVPGDFVEQTGIQIVSKEELLNTSDFVSLNCTLNPTSYRLVGEPELEMMPNTACLVNTARGPLIDQPALIRALQHGQIAGAALDVFEEEPLPLDSPLREMQNVLLAPHNANSSPTAWEYVHWNTINNLLEELHSNDGCQSENRTNALYSGSASS